ncbi:MAG: TolC family protein [Vicinamibacterales bacterium]
MTLAFVLALELTLLPAAQARPAPPAPVPLTLSAAVTRARTSSPFRTSAQNLATGAALAAQLAGRTLNPVVEFRTENWGHGSSLPIDVFATANQTLELGGKRAARMGFALAERDVANANLQLTDRQLALRTAQLYVQALKARGLLATLRASKEGLSTLIASVRRRVEEGYSAESDLLRFDTEAARVDIEIAKAGLELDRSLASLTVIVGAPEAITAEQLVDPPELAVPAAQQIALAAAVARHPEVVAADARQARAQQATALERARTVPDPTITLGYKRTAGFNSAVAGVLFAVPLFERNGASVARAAGEQSAAAAERNATARRLEGETTALIHAAQALSDQSTRAAGELLAPAESVRNAARATFREGTTDVLKLIDAERVYADVQRVALDLRLDALVATLEARFALGEESLP